MVMSGSFLGLYLQFSTVMRGSSVARDLWVVIFAGALPFQIRMLWPVMRTFLLGEPFCWMLAGLALASQSWSMLPEVSARRAVLFLLVLCYGAYLSARYSWREFLALARLALRLGLLLSLLFTLVRPEMGIHQSSILAGSWSGLYLHKNSFGHIGGLLIALAWSQAAAGLGRGWLAVDTSIGLLVLSLSRARTAAGVALLVGCSLVWGWLWLRSRAGLKLGLAALGLLTVSLVAPMLYFSLDRLAGMNWDHLLTGRVELWKLVLYLVSKRPWSGYGYKAFFEEQAFGRMILMFEHWRVPHAHNVVLELAADLGVFGILLYLATVALFVVRLGRHLCLAGLLPLGVLVFNLLTGFTETECYPDTQVNSLIFVYFAFSLGVRLKVARAQATGYPDCPA